MGLSTTRLARWVLPFYLGAIYATLGFARVITNQLRDAGLLRGAVVIAFGLAAMVVVVVLARDRPSRSPRVLTALVVVGAAYAAAIVPMASPEEKLHFIEYGGVALLALAASPQRWSLRSRFVGAALFVSAAGWIDEGIQALLPSRYYDLRDVGFNAAAGVMALVAFAVIRWARGAPEAVSTTTAP